MSLSITIRELQQIYLDMIAEFNQFCLKHNLTYYMVGGTLLGAVREKGFIPWDDDVDFAMPRPDYERLIKIYDGNMILNCYQKNLKYSFPYIKIFHPKNPSVTINDKIHGIKNSKVFVQFDIYPLDGVGCEEAKANKTISAVNRWKTLWYKNFTRDSSPLPIKNIALLLFRMIPNYWFVRIIDHKMKKHSYNTSDYITRWRGSSFFAKGWFGTPTFIQFENLVLPAPSAYDVYLTSVYGNYKIPFRENEGMRHSINNTINDVFVNSVEKK